MYNRKVFEETEYAYRHGVPVTDVANYYSEWATEYEKGYHTEGVYSGPRLVTETFGSIYKDNRESIRVLDVAVGTGILGEELHKLGFRNIDGLDPAQGMLDICKTKNIYTNLICDFMTENPSQITADTYDCLGVSGGMGPGHIPSGALLEMTRIVKPGGYICIVMRFVFLEEADEYNNRKLENTIDQLEKAGRLKKVERRVFQNYFCKKDGVMFLFKVL